MGLSFILNTSTWEALRLFKANLFKLPLFNSGEQFKLAATGFDINDSTMVNLEFFERKIKRYRKYIWVEFSNRTTKFSAKEKKENNETTGVF